MAFTKTNIIAIRDDLLTLLRANTTTLNANLTLTITSTTKQIQKGNPELLTTPSTQYPYIFVEIGSKQEEFKTLGGGGRKQAIYTFNIYALAKKMTSRTADDDEAVHLADNIDTLLRNNISFSSKVLWSNPVSVDYAHFQLTNSLYVMGSITNFEFLVDVSG